VELLLGMAFTSLLLLYVLILGLTEGRRRYQDCARREEAEKKARALFKIMAIAGATRTIRERRRLVLRAQGVSAGPAGW
jgi:hypothetical protein